MLDLTDIELSALPNLLALARINIGAQLAQGAQDEEGRAEMLLAACRSIAAKIPKGEAHELLPARKRKENGKEAHA